MLDRALPELRARLGDLLDDLVAEGSASGYGEVERAVVSAEMQA